MPGRITRERPQARRDDSHEGPNLEADSGWSRSLTFGGPITGYLSGAFAIAIVTVLLSPIRVHLGLLNIGLLFLSAAVLISARWGWGPGLSTSVLANLAFNFFFVPPLYTFTVQEPRNALALLVFLAVSSLSSGLLARARRGEQAARRREQETAILYSLSRAIIEDLDLSSVLSAIGRQVVETFGVDSCAMLDTAHADPLILATVGPARESAIRSRDELLIQGMAIREGRAMTLGRGYGLRAPRIIGAIPRTPVAYAPMRAGGRVIGLLRVAGVLNAHMLTPDQIQLLQAFADQSGLAVERDRLLGEAAQVRAMAETDRLKSSLLSAVSHDLRTPLASIKASATSLLSDEIEWDRTTQREFLQAIDQETDRLTRLVSNLLDLSRIEAGVLRPEKDWYDPAEPVVAVAARLRRTLTQHTIRTDVAAGLPLVPLDYTQIDDVLTNLVENAAKFSPPASEIVIAARSFDGAVEFSITDHGPGIPPAERSRVFERFHRLGGAGSSVKGSGLGLAICKGLVEAHGGRLWVEAAPKGGARFAFTLPAPPSPKSMIENDGATALAGGTR